MTGSARRQVILSLFQFLIPRGLTDPEDADPWTPVGVEDDDRRLVVT